MSWENGDPQNRGPHPHFTGNPHFTDNGDHLVKIGISVSPVKWGWGSPFYRGSLGTNYN